MPLPKKYHAITFMGALIMLLLLGLYLLSGGYSQVAESQTAESRAAALARNSTGSQQLQLPSSSNTLPAYRHPISYDKLTGATNNQINDVLGAGKQPHSLIGDYPIDHYQQQQQQQQLQQQQQQQQFHPNHPNLLGDPLQQQRHRQQMLDRQMLFGGAPNPINPFGPPPHELEYSPPPPPVLNQTNQPNYYPDPALYRQQQQQQQPIMQPPMPFQLPPPPPPPPPQSQPQQHQHQHQQQQQQPTNQAPIRPPYAHLGPMNMPPMSQYTEQQQQQQQPLQPPSSSSSNQHQQHQQLKPAQNSRIIPLNSRIDPTSTSAATQSHLPPQQLVLNQQAPIQKNSNSSPPSMQPSLVNGGNGNRLIASSTSNAIVPLCVKQQLDQQQQQVQPIGDTVSSSNNSNNNSSSSRLQMPILFCNIDPEYPTKEIMRALEIYAQEQKTIEHLLPQLLIQLHIQAQPARQPGGNHQLLTLDQLQSSLTNLNQSTSSSSSSSSSDNKQFPSANFEQMCRSTIQMAQPRRAKNLAGQWKIVVNLPGHKYRGIAISQMVRVDECSVLLGECATPSKPSTSLAKSSCLQHYENQRLVAWSPQQGLHLDMFRMPVACSCHIRRS